MLTPQSMAAFIPNEKCLILLDDKRPNFLSEKNAAGDHPGLAVPSTADRAP